MTPGPGPSGLLGRTGEREVLDRLLADACAGQSAALVLRGEAGIGKTALLRYAARQASGFRVARVAGVEAEMELPFAGIHQLCAPLLEDGLDALPPLQRAALRVALGLAPGDPPDPFLVGLTRPTRRRARRGCGGRPACSSPRAWSTPRRGRAAPGRRG